LVVASWAVDPSNRRAKLWRFNGFSKWRQSAILDLLRACLDHSSDSATQTASRSVQPLLHSSLQSVRILYNGSPVFALEISPSHGGLGPPSNTWFFEPSLARNPNGFSIGSAVFAGPMTALTDRRTNKQTDRQTMLIGVYQQAASTNVIGVEMRPNNNNTIYNMIYQVVFI